MTNKEAQEKLFTVTQTLIEIYKYLCEIPALPTPLPSLIEGKKSSPITC